MAQTITELKAAAYDARARHEAALEADRRFPEFVARFPVLEGAEPDPPGYDRGGGVTPQWVFQRRLDLAMAVRSSREEWERAEAALLNAVADETGLNEYFQTAPFYNRMALDTDDVRGAL